DVNPIPVLSHIAVWLPVFLIGKCAVTLQNRVDIFGGKRAQKLFRRFFGKFGVGECFAHWLFLLDIFGDAGFWRGGDFTP
ncbi:MAG: hypothetical protein MPK10_06750, partial [Gammaproteobacteria bacterium]|nr:hypothetical protein [Gammaproteobacteria bacterium]